MLRALHGAMFLSSLRGKSSLLMPALLKSRVSLIAGSAEGSV